MNVLKSLQLKVNFQNQIRIQRQFIYFCISKNFFQKQFHISKQNTMQNCTKFINKLLISFQEIEVLSVLGKQAHKTAIFFTLLLAWGLFYSLINAIFKLQGLPKKKQEDIKTRIVSMVHGVTTFVWSTYLFLPYPDYSHSNTQQETMICMFSFSYFVYDLLICIYYGLTDASLYLHHLSCAFGFGAAAFSGNGGIFGVAGLFIAQSSNFPMHLRIILKIQNLRYTKGYQVSENLYIFLYILFRGVLGPVFILYPCITAIIPVRIVSFLLIFQSFYYIWNMIGIIQKKIKQQKEMKEKKIEYKWFQETPELSMLSFYKFKSEEQKIF